MDKSVPAYALYRWDKSGSKGLNARWEVGQGTVSACKEKKEKNGR